MPTADVTIQWVNAVKPGKKYGSVKTSEGQIYAVPPALLREFGQGEVCKIEFGVWDSGGMHITKKISSETYPAGQMPKQNIRPATNPADSDRMATMGMVNNFIACGRVALDVDEIARAIDVCNDGLNRSVIKGKQTQRRDDLQDEIPY